MRIHKELHGGSVILKFVVVTFNSSTVLQTSFQTSHFLKQLQLPGSFQCGPSMWRRRTTVTGLVCIVWTFFSFMHGYQLTFSKAWSQLPAESPVVLPWDRGCWKHVVGGKKFSSIQPVILKRPMPPPILYNSSSGEQQHHDKRHRAQSSDATSWHQIVRSSCDDSWTEMRDSKFQIALRRWLDVLLQLPPECGIVIQLKQVGDISHQLRMLRDIFAKKAPQTLLKRCHSFLRFMCHLKDVGETFPGTEPGFYSFLCGLRDSGATTSNLQSVVQALNFAQHVVGLPELAVVTTSRRCIGAVGMRNVGPKRQAHPFTVSELLVLHSVLLDQCEDSWNRVFAGTVLFAVYSRSRWMDMQHAETMEVDTDFTGFTAYVELHISVHKCQESTAFRNTFLTAVAPNLGITADPWIQAWLDVRLKLGIDFTLGLPTLPAPNSDGLPTKRPLSTDEMKQWLRLILSSKGVSLDGRRLTSHSCKCTLLSWLAKHGDEWADRMALGGHVSFMKSAIVYSRDAMARPIRVLEKLLLDVRLGRFCPDESRSGRFKDVSTGHADIGSDFADVGFGDNSLDLVGPVQPNKLDDDIIVIDSDEAETNDVKHETAGGSSSDSDVLTTSSSEDEAGARCSGASRVMRLPTVPDSLKLIQHTKYKTLHLMEKQNEKIMLCGRAIVQGRYDVASEARFDTPCCHQCWKHKPEYDT